MTPQPLDPSPPERLYRSGMLRRFGPLYYLLLLGFLLRKLLLTDTSAERIRSAANRGPLVYVLHTAFWLDWLALNRVLNAHRLPLARFTHGLVSWRFAPLRSMLRGGWRALQERLLRTGPPDPVRSGWLAEAVAQGMPTAIFLVHGGEGHALDDDPMAALVAAQARCERPIQLVPIVAIWSRDPGSAWTENMRVIIGSGDEPGPLRKIWSLLSSQSQPRIEAGEPVDLRELLARTAEAPVARQVKTARLLLRRYLYREAHVVRGPRIRPFRWTRRLVLASPEVKKLIADESLATGKSEERVHVEVMRTLDHIAARLSWPVMRVAAWVTRFVWERIYAGIDVREEDLERVRAALRKGTPVLVPCHRSHLDYLLISSLLDAHDIVIPHVIAGENLSFWPVGAIARRLGAVFIRRSFKGQRVFPVVFERYLRQIIRDGFPVEFFIEGTRSRSGKLLPPKLGVLGMVIDAAAAGREDREVTLLPIAISYEQIAEERSYAAELAGAAKEPEDIGQVVRASKVIRKRYGRVYLRVGEPLPVGEVLGGAATAWRELDREHRRERLQTTGERLMFRIAESMVLLPTGLVAMALLAQARRGIRRAELHARVARLRSLLVAAGATPAATLENLGRATDEALRRFQSRKLVGTLADEAGDILVVADDRRITLEYYKNGILHFVVPASLMAAAVAAVCLAPEPGAAARGPDSAEVLRLFRQQVFLFRYEFTLDPELSVEALAARALDALVAYGALARGPEGELAVGEPALLAELAGITRNFVESYALVLRAAHALRTRDLSIEDLPRHVATVGKGLLAVDELRRPEALSVENLKNAVAAFREEGVIQVKAGGGGLQFDEGALGQHSADLARLLGRSVSSEAPFAGPGAG